MPPVESGLSGIVQGPPIDYSPIENFGAMLIKAKEMKRQAAMADFQAASKIAETDPVLAEEIGGKALKDLSKHTGQTNTEMYFKNIYQQAQTGRQQQEQMFNQKIKESNANIGASEASATLAGAQTEDTKAQAESRRQQNETNMNIRMAETRLGSNTYADDEKGKSQRVADVALLQIEKGLDQKTAEYMRLSPKDQKEVDRLVLDTQRDLHSKVQLEIAEDLGNLQVPDEKTNGKTMRGLTADEINNAVTNGKLPPNVSGIEKQKLATELQRLSIERINANANMINAKAYAGLTDMQKGKLNAERELDLAKADALKKKGIVTSYDDVLKAFQALRDEKLSGGKPDPTLMRQLETEIAKFYGGKPDQYTDWLGNLKDRGFVFGQNVDDQALSGATGAPAKADQGPATMGGKTGEVVRQLPDIGKNLIEGTTGAVKSNVEDFITQLAGESRTGGTPQTTVQDQTISGHKIPAGSKARLTADGSMEYTLPDGTKITVPRQK